jgi:small subunit ribosomal protein S24e
MELEILKKEENPLLSRTRIKFRIVHPKASTPTREMTRKMLLDALETKPELLILRHIKTIFGSDYSEGLAFVYENETVAKAVETKPILARNFEKKEKKGKKKK